MTIDERLRLSIHTKLTDLIGHDEADALIAHIMPVPWHDVATKDDIQLVRNEISLTRAELRTEIAEVRAQLGAEIAEVRVELGAEIAELRSELRTEIADVRSELRTEIADVRTEISGLRSDMNTALAAVRIDVHDAIVGQTRWLLGYVTALSVVMLGVARLMF